MSMAIELADAVADVLNGEDEEFSQVFEASRAYLPVFSLEELATLRVTVVPGAWDSETETREATSDEYVISIGVQKKVDPRDLDELDALMDLVEEIARRLARPGLLEDYDWLGTENNPLYSPVLLDTKGVFQSVIRVTWETNVEVQ